MKMTNTKRLSMASNMSSIKAGRKIYKGTDFQKSLFDKAMKNKDKYSLVESQIAIVEAEPDSDVKDQKLAYLDYKLNNLIKLYVDASDETIDGVDDLQAIGAFSFDGKLNADGILSGVPMWVKIGVPSALLIVAGILVYKKYRTTV